MAARTYLTDGDHIRLTNNLPDDVTDAMLSPHLAAARRQLRSDVWIGATQYDAALTLITSARAGLGAGETLETHGALTTITESMRIAECYLAFMIALPKLNLNYQANGFIVNTSFPEGAKSQMGGAMIKQLQREAKLEASRAVKDYLLTGSPSMGKVVADYDE